MVPASFLSFMVACSLDPEQTYKIHHKIVFYEIRVLFYLAPVYTKSHA